MDGNDEFPPSNSDTPAQRSRQISESSTSGDQNKRYEICNVHLL